MSEKIARQAIDAIIPLQEKMWRRSLALPLNLQLIKDAPETEKQWPVRWNIRDGFVLYLHDTFQLENTWWNFNSIFYNWDSLSLFDQYVLVLAHEITHFFMYPSPLYPWFQESVAMKLGQLIAVQLVPQLQAIFPMNQESLDMNAFTNASYGQIGQNIAQCSAFQKQAYLFANAYFPDTLIKWTEQLQTDDPDLFKDFTIRPEINAQIAAVLQDAHSNAAKPVDIL